MHKKVNRCMNKTIFYRSDFSIVDYDYKKSLLAISNDSRCRSKIRRRSIDSFRNSDSHTLNSIDI